MTLALASTMPAIGQTILEEDFETGLTQSAKTPLTRTEGWTTIDSYKGTDKTYNWYNYYADPTSQAGPTISGANCAACAGPISSVTSSARSVRFSPSPSWAGSPSVSPWNRNPWRRSPFCRTCRYSLSSSSSSPSPPSASRPGSMVPRSTSVMKHSSERKGLTA